MSAPNDPGLARRVLATLSLGAGLMLLASAVVIVVRGEAAPRVDVGASLVGLTLLVGLGAGATGVVCIAAAVMLGGRWGRRRP